MECSIVGRSWNPHVSAENTVPQEKLRKFATPLQVACDHQGVTQPTV